MVQVDAWKTGVFIVAGRRYHDKNGVLVDEFDDMHDTGEKLGDQEEDAQNFFVFCRRKHETDRQEHNNSGGNTIIGVETSHMVDWYP
jgi:hypothetical protein